VAQQLAGRLADGNEDRDIPLPPVVEAPRRASDAVIVEGSDDVWVTLARCCTPVPRDAIMGFVTRGRGVSVHRVDCPNADDLRSDPERIIEVAWNTHAPSSFRVTIEVEAIDRKHLLRDITSVMGDLSVNILSANVATGRDRQATARFTFELADIAHLDHILSSVRRIESVYDAYRVVPKAAQRAPGP
jgi:GTP pyrophosphokinase